MTITKETRSNYNEKFTQNGITYYIQLLPISSKETAPDGYVAKWWDDSDNGLGYNNRGFIGIDATIFNKNKPVEDRLYVNSSFDRTPKFSIQNRLKNITLELLQNMGYYRDEVNEELNPYDYDYWNIPHHYFVIYISAGRVEYPINWYETYKEAEDWCKEHNWKYVDRNRFEWDLRLDDEPEYVSDKELVDKSYDDND